MKRQVTDQEKTFANHISDKRFASRIYTTSEKSIIRKQTIQVLKKPYQYYIQKYQDYVSVVAQSQSVTMRAHLRQTA